MVVGSQSRGLQVENRLRRALIPFWSTSSSWVLLLSRPRPKLKLPPKGSNKWTNQITTCIPNFDTHRSRIYTFNDCNKSKSCWFIKTFFTCANYTLFSLTCKESLYFLSLDLKYVLRTTTNISQIVIGQMYVRRKRINGLVRIFSIPIVNALGILQSCTKPSVCNFVHMQERCNICRALAYVVLSYTFHNAYTYNI